MNEKSVNGIIVIGGILVIVYAVYRLYTGISKAVSPLSNAINAVHDEINYFGAVVQYAGKPTPGFGAGQGFGGGERFGANGAVYSVNNEHHNNPDVIDMITPGLGSNDISSTINVGNGGGVR
jgi:hypothetical protein